MQAASVLDYRELARRRIPHFLFEYIDGGSYDEVTLCWNVQDLRRIAFRQRVMTDVSTLDLTTELFGQALNLPIALGPIGLAGLTARRGEIQAAKAAEAAGIPFCLSTLSVCSLAEVTQAVSRPIWFQLYMIRDRAFMRDLLAEARELGCSALLFTVDLAVPGSRYRDARSGLGGTSGLATMRRLWQSTKRPNWSWDVGVRGRPLSLGNLASLLGPNQPIADYFGWLRENFDPSISWKDLEFIRSVWHGPLVLKGILDAHDARAARDIGADGLVVSNHGGRQLDGVPSTTSVLAAVAEAVGDELTVLVDGGVRSGLDVVRMLALGAKVVLLGRAWAYALAGAGRSGVTHMLSLIEAEMRVAMALTGVTSIGRINDSILADYEAMLDGGNRGSKYQSINVGK